MEEYYQKKYKKYKIKYLERREEINNELIGGSTDIFVFFINNFNAFVKEEEDNNNKVIETLKEQNLHSILIITELKLYNIFLGIISFLFCIVCRLINLPTEFSNITIKVAEIMREFIINKNSIKFIHDLQNIIPCINIKYILQLFTELINKVKNKGKDIAEFIIIKKNKVISNSTKTLNNLTSSLKNNCYFKKILNNLRGGDVSITECEKYNLIRIFNIIKFLSIEELNDIINDILYDTNYKVSKLKILYVCKYLINILLMSFETNNEFDDLFNFIDSMLSFLIAITILEYEILTTNITSFITKIIPEGVLKKELIDILVRLLNNLSIDLSTSQSCQ
jgi:hypothetical protein